MEKSLQQFSEASPQLLTHMEHDIIKDFEAESARARAMGSRARLLYPTKGCGALYHGTCADGADHQSLQALQALPVHRGPEDVLRFSWALPVSI